MTALYIASIALGILTIFDMVRRPESEWAAADRERSWWIWMAGFATFLACGVVIAVIYAVGLLPRFGRRAASDDTFRKARGVTSQPQPLTWPAPTVPVAPRDAAVPALPARHEPTQPPAPPSPAPPAAGRRESNKLIVEFDD